MDRRRSHPVHSLTCIQEGQEHPSEWIRPRLRYRAMQPIGVTGCGFSSGLDGLHLEKSRENLERVLLYSHFV